MLPELQAVLSRPSQPLRRHDQRDWHLVCLRSRRAAEPREDFAYTVGGKYGLPAQHDHAAGWTVERRPSRDSRVQRLEDVIADQSTNLDHSDCGLHSDDRTSGAEGPFFFLHPIAPVLVDQRSSCPADNARGRVAQTMSHRAHPIRRDRQ